MPNVVIPPGKYRVIDSSEKTWSANADTKGQGMTRVLGIRQSVMAPP